MMICTTIYVWPYPACCKRIRLLRIAAAGDIIFRRPISMSSSLFDRIEHARGRFRRDVADQLRMAVEQMGVAATVTLDHERAVLEFDDGTLPRVIAVFDDAEDGESYFDQMTISVETAEERRTVLTLAWHDAPGLLEDAALQRRLAELEARTDDSLPLERRGLNAPADQRTGRYARGDVIRQLAADFKHAGPQASPAVPRSHALVAIEPPRPVLARAPVRAERSEDSERGSPQTPVAGGIDARRTNVSEVLISSLVHALQRDLTEAESHLIGPGAAASVRRRVGRVMEWAMLGAAYGVEVKTNQMAVASFLGSPGASWLYALVGPVLIGGLAVLSKSKLGKGAAYGLMLSWALAMATITASDKDHLDRAQGYFPRQAVVLTHEQAVAAARLAKEAAEAELKRLNTPLKGPSELLADAETRWQAAEIKRAAEREGLVREKDRVKARQAAIEAGVTLNQEQLRLREAITNDPSRAWAWWTLFAIFAIINLAGPLAISRVLERWRADHAEAQASATDGYRKRSRAAWLRGSRAAQEAHAMQLLPELLHDLKRDRVAPEVIAGLDLGAISQKAAERFLRGVNGARTTPRWFGPRRSAEGPGLG